MNCQFSNPVNLGTETNPDWEFSEMTCDEITTKPSTSTYFEIEHPTSSIGNFRIDKSYSFGEITQILISGMIFFLLLFYIIKKVLTKEEVEAEVKSMHKW
jgi:hypothetical protein